MRMSLGPPNGDQNKLHLGSGYTQNESILESRDTQNKPNLGNRDNMLNELDYKSLENFFLYFFWEGVKIFKKRRHSKLVDFRKQRHPI